MTLIYLSCAWLAGILLGSLLHPPSGFVWLLTSLPLAVLFLWREERRARLLGTCALALLLGALRYNAAAVPQRFDEGHIAHYNDKGWVAVRGIVAGEPDVRDTYTNLRVAAERLEIEGQEREVWGLVLVRAPRYPGYRYGDKLEVEGLLTTPPEFEDFSYKDYLARQGIYSLLRRPRIALLARGRGSPLRAALLAFKGRAQATIARILPEPQASLLTGILLGVEGGIPADLMEDFNRTGTTHIIAISGFNISIIAGLLSGLSTRLFGRRRATPLALAGIALYTILVGASAAVVRAAIMGCLYIIAAHYGRQTEALTSLVAAAVLMTALNPHTLWDVGFQLSFAATLGLILYTPSIESWFERALARILPPGAAEKIVGLLNEALIVTLAAQITTLPIIVYNFRRLSLVTLLTNLLILPAQPGVMVWGGVATIAGLIWQPLGHVLGWVAWLFLTYTIRAVEVTAAVPHASVSLGRVSPGSVWLYYALLAILSREGPSRLKALWQRLTDRLPTKMAIAGLAVAVLLVWIAVGSLPDGKLHVVFLDVGQGDTIFIRTPRGHKVLIDGGPKPAVLMAALGRKMPFWDRTIDLVILTHPDSDHLTGLIPVLEHYRVGQVLDSGYEHTTLTYQRWLELIKEKDIPAHLARAGMRIWLEEGLELAILHPGPELVRGTKADSNNNSVVARLAIGRVSFLFPGDIEEVAEGMLLVSGQELASTVLKVPHHGSDTSSSAPFLEAVNPQLAIISVGADNRFGCPSPEVVERLEGRAVLKRTDEDGTIEVVTDGERLWVRTER